ncbi:MAG: hypothetical protein AAB422_00545, partial [Planctomycetota bacterium]
CSGKARLATTQLKAAAEGMILLYRKFKVRPERPTGYSGGGEAPCKNSKIIPAPKGRQDVLFSNSKF